MASLTVTILEALLATKIVENFQRWPESLRTAVYVDLESLPSFAVTFCIDEKFDETKLDMNSNIEFKKEIRCKNIVQSGIPTLQDIIHSGKQK